MVHVTCTALNCPSSSRTHAHLKFHQLPHDPKRRKIWLKACKRTDVIDKESSFFKHKYVCSLHFHKCMYTSKDYLRKTAVPSLHLSAKPILHDASTQTEEFKQYGIPYQNFKEQQCQNNLSILNVKKSSTSNTQIEGSTGYHIYDIDVKEEPESFEPDVEMETEKYDDADYEDNDLNTSEECEDIKPDIGETEILPLPQSTLSLQSLDFLRYSIHHIDVNKEIIAQKNTEESQYFKPEIKKENDDDVDKNCDLATSEEDVKNKLEIDETEIIPLTPGLHFMNSHIMKDGEILCTQSKNPLQDINQDKTATVVTKRTLSAINTIDVSVQTDRVMVLNQNPNGSVSVNSEICTCEENDPVQMTRAQFYRCCSKFLSARFCEIVRKQVSLERFTEHVDEELSRVGKTDSERLVADCNGGIEKSATDLDVESAAEGREMVSSDFVVAGTKTAEVDLLAEVDASVAVSEADCARSISEGPPPSKKRRN